MRDFPTDFLWGAATAAHQVEGGLRDNDWAQWEQQGHPNLVEPAGVGIDQWNRWREDVALLAELGHRAHRFSLEWSRLEPEPGRYDDIAFAHYGAVLDELHSLGVTPFVTLQHFTVPGWFARRGGWLADDAEHDFTAFAAECARRLGSRMPWACTINEPQIVAVMGHLLGSHPPGLRDEQAAITAGRALRAAHRGAVRAFAREAPAARVGVALAMLVVEPADESAREPAALLDQLLTQDYLDDLAGGDDRGHWVGVQYYTRLRVPATLDRPFTPPATGTETTQMGWEVYPQGFARVLHRAAGTGLPVVVTENGIATEDDRQRLRFVRAHLGVLHDVMTSGVEVLGYFYWSAFDNYEWTHGYRPRFGLVGIDRDDDLRRVVRPSALAYRDLIRTGRLSALDPPARSARRARDD